MDTHSVLTKQAGHTSLRQVFGLAKHEVEAIAALGFNYTNKAK